MPNLGSLSDVTSLPDLPLFSFLSVLVCEWPSKLKELGIPVYPSITATLFGTVFGNDNDYH